MPSKSLENHRKAQTERLQAILHDLLMEEENKYCADCDAKQPRWASWNLGVFVCIRCAGIHRSIGVQVSKVKSVNLDSWTPEQVQSMRVMGNAKAKAIYEAELPRDYRRPQTEQQLEMFIRAKYEHKRYMMRDWEPPKIDVADLIPALEKGPNRSSFKKISAKVSEKGLQPPSLPSPKLPSPKQPSPSSAGIIDMQLLDFSDAAPTSSTNTSNQEAAPSKPLSFFDEDLGARDVTRGVDVLQLSDKLDGGVDDELEDMFGPIVSAPRAESFSEPPVETNTANNAFADTSMQQSASSTNLGDLASLAAPNPGNNKISNADILALFGSEPQVRPVIQPQMMPAVPQGIPYVDPMLPGMSAARAQLRFPAPAGFPQTPVSYASNGVAPQQQQQFPFTPNGPMVPPVNNMMGNFMSKETFAMFAAASPFASTTGPTSPPPNLLGGSLDLLGVTAVPNTAASAGMTTSLPSAGMTSNTLFPMFSSDNQSGVMATSASESTADHWPFPGSSVNAAKLSPQNALQGNGTLKKDPFASLNNCFANFDNFSAGKATTGSHAETAAAPNISLWD